MGTVSSAKVIAIPSMEKRAGADDRGRDGSARQGFVSHLGSADANS